jgi:hypothetical protein
MSINLEGFVRRKTKINLGGKDWTFTELSLADFASFRARMVKDRKAALAEKRAQLIEEAKGIGNIDPLKLLEHLDKPVTDDEMDAEMETVEGVGFMAYLSLKYTYPEVTEDDALRIVSIEKIGEIVGAMIGVIETDKKKPKRTQAKGKAGQR